MNVYEVLYSGQYLLVRYKLINHEHCIFIIHDSMAGRAAKSFQQISTLIELKFISAT